MALDVVVLTTGPLVTLDEVKAHLRYTETDQDELIGIYTDAAVLACLDHCGLKLVPQGAEPAFKAAALLMIGDLWSTRSANIIGTIITPSPTVGNLLRPYRIIRI